MGGGGARASHFLFQSGGANGKAYFFSTDICPRKALHCIKPRFKRFKGNLRYTENQVFKNKDIPAFQYTAGNPGGNAIGCRIDKLYIDDHVAL